MANSIPSSQPFSPTHWVPERCKERQTTLSKDARDRHHPIGSICASVVFDLLPSDTLKMPVNLWDVHPPHGWRSNLKEALLSTDFDEKGITITEQLLTTPLLSVLLHIGYEHVKEVMGRCCYPEARAYVAQKKGFHVGQVIRTNLEKNPFFSISFTFVDDLCFLIRLANQCSYSFDQLSFGARFTQKLCDYLKDPARILTTPEDHCFLYITQFVDSCIDPLQGTEFKQQLFEECQKESALLLISKTIDDGTDALDESVLSQLFFKLYQVSECFGEEMWIQVLTNFKLSVEELLNDQRKKQSVHLSLDLWEEVSPLSYGVLPLFEESALLEVAFEHLDALPLHTSKSEAAHQLILDFFDECDPTPRLAAATWLYKIWWLNHRREQKIQSHVDALVDWYAHECLAEDDNWELDEQSALQRIEELFRACTPLLPFNAQRAERMYFDLHRAKAADNRNNSARVPHEERS